MRGRSDSLLGGVKVLEWVEQAGRRVGRIDAELLMVLVLDVEERAVLYSRQGERVLSAEELARLETGLERRERGEPLAYIVGWKEFFGRRFLVDRRVLAPRGETEAMVEAVVRGYGVREGGVERSDEVGVQKGSEWSEVRRGGRVRILEVGTGSGCVAVSLKCEMPEAEVVASDISEGALAVARENAERWGAEVEFVQGDLLERFLGEGAEGGRFDVIVANLPYVDREWGWLGKELVWEPEEALYAEEGGLALIRRLIEQASEVLREDGMILLEMDTCQLERGREMAEKQGFLVEKVSDFVLKLVKK